MQALGVLYVAAHFLAGGVAGTSCGAGGGGAFHM